MAHKIPVTIITGFLGSGKTTLIRHLIQTSQRRLAVLVNEFGELGIDGELLADCGACTDIIELANGCVCCTVQDEFLPAMQKLLAQRDRIDHIVIETSGLALPKPLVTAFRWPEIREATTVDSVVTVVDCAAVVAGTFAVPADAEVVNDHAETPLSELFEDQLACADLVILNKADRVTPAELATVKEQVQQEVGTSVAFLSAEHSRIDSTLVLGLAAAVEDHLEERPSHHDDLEDDHDHDAFSSVEWRSPLACDPQHLLDVLASLLRTYTIYRVKGFVAVPRKPMRWQVQGVGQRLTGYYDRPWGHTKPQTQLVLIGMDLPQDDIYEALETTTVALSR